MRRPNCPRRRSRSCTGGLPRSRPADRLLGSDHGAVVPAGFRFGGIEGKMFHPLAYTKTFALVAVAGLAITLVPALCTILIRGHLRSEMENPLIRSVIEVYRPVLSYLMDQPAALAWVLGGTFLFGLAPLGARPAFLATLFAAIVATAL